MEKIAPFFIQLKEKVTQIEHYYPFGMSMNKTAPSEVNPVEPSDKHKYNGKRQEEIWGMLNYGARFYDPAIGRFISIDPLAEQFPHQSGYVYADNDPVGKVDWMGLSGESHHIGKDGNYIGEINDGDDGVYMHSEGTTLQDIQANQYYDSANGIENFTSGRGLKVEGSGVQIEDTPLDPTSVRQEGFRLIIAVGLGLTIAGGGIRDSKGNHSSYFEIGLAGGLDASLGFEQVRHKNNDLKEFDIYSIEGSGLMNNYGAGAPIGRNFSNGGDQSRMNFSAGSRGSKYHSVNGTDYSSLSAGGSIGLTPISFTQTTSYTWVF